MMSWSNVCVEGFCFGDKDDSGNYPCGRSCPSCLCLENGHCPHFAYSETTERMVAVFPPLRLVLWDRLIIFVTETLYWKLRWWFWDCLWFNRRKTRAFFANIPIATKENCPIVEDLDREVTEATEKFPDWFSGVKNKANGVL